LSYKTYHRGPDASNGHVLEPLALEIYGQALGQDTHADLTHGIGGLAAEEAAVDGRADNDDAAVRAEMWQSSLDDGVEALWVDALHELEALEGGVADGCPPDGAGVVDEDVEAAIFLKKGKKNVS
jgi:hypothetical protein